MLAATNIKVMNIKQFTYEIFDSLTHGGSKAGSFVTDLKSKRQDANNIQPGTDEQAPPQAQTFSADEVELAKNLAREEGISQGYAQAKKQAEEQNAEKETKIASVVAALATEIERVNNKIDERKSLLTAEFSDIAVSLAKQICNNLPSDAMLTQTQSLIKEALDSLDDSQRIKITLSPKNAAELNGKFTGVELKPLAEIAEGDFRIEWQNGYLERDTQKLWDNMQAVLSKHFAKTHTGEKIETVSQVEAVKETKPEIKEEIKQETIETTEIKTEQQGE